jgi:hypothetical protein
LSVQQALPIPVAIHWTLVRILAIQSDESWLPERIPRLTDKTATISNLADLLVGCVPPLVSDSYRRFRISQFLGTQAIGSTRTTATSEEVLSVLFSLSQFDDTTCRNLRIALDQCLEDDIAKYPHAEFILLLFRGVLS